MRPKTILRLRKSAESWSISCGMVTDTLEIGISRLFRLISTWIIDKDNVYSIDIVIKRRK